MLADIKETLNGLRAINLKLNPKKCSFGVEEGIFSGDLITKQGIKVNPPKVKAISDLQPSKSVSKIQNLNKKLAVLNRFLSKGANKTLPFMLTLKSCTSRKMVQWTSEANEAFRRMKELLEALPTLVANQVNGLFEARQTVIKQYLEKAKELLANFPCHSIEHIKRDQNKKVDALSKMALMTFSKLAKKS
uniref:Reverse transcriptase domain-containing protein n=1 Tax=Tanacetum cinerariifolium TaxID=118510 RepID=A0A6L2NZP1_TANCI|nr:reverse transcriptase domain-containing protein [Tanacetum cinerariifolium]